MNCTICGQGNVDGAIGTSGGYICVDCWASGEAYIRGEQAESFVPANVPYHVDYPIDIQKRFLDACNLKK
jgi:hypothetical protein